MHIRGNIGPENWQGSCCWLVSCRQVTSHRLGCMPISMTSDEPGGRERLSAQVDTKRLMRSRREPTSEESREGRAESERMEESGTGITGRRDPLYGQKGPGVQGGSSQKEKIGPIILSCHRHQTPYRARARQSAPRPRVLHWPSNSSTAPRRPRPVLWMR